MFFFTMLDMEGAGIIKRIWMTINHREDDVSSVAYFYLNQPISNLPVLPQVDVRIKKLID